ncbi:hypothetical protein [Archangium sp.]|uniref:hypothetical protein n=1 Tax=Archangium sp. TaxID=1872627 RepID=UPI002ED779E0
MVERLGRHASGLASAAKVLERSLAESAYTPQRVVRTVEKLVEAFIPLLDPALRPDPLLEGWKALATRARLEMESDFREACAARRWRLEGQWPDVYIERGVRVHVQEDGRVVTIGSERLIEPGITEIVEALAPQVEVLIPKSFDPARFMEELAAAYDEIAGPQPAQVPILELYKSLVIRSQSSRFWKDARETNFVPLSQDQFRARLSEALERDATETRDGRGIRLAPPLNTKDALFVYQPAEGRFGYVGRVDFIRAEGGEP